MALRAFVVSSDTAPELAVDQRGVPRDGRPHTQSQNKWKQYCVGESNDPKLKTLSLVSCQWGREHAGAATGKFAFDGGKFTGDGLKYVFRVCFGLASGRRTSSLGRLWYGTVLHDGARLR